MPEPILSPKPTLSDRAEPDAAQAEPIPAPSEVGGRAGPDPVRYGDWEKNGRCIDF